MSRSRLSAALGACITLVAVGVPVRATIVGLNQIVTAEIQPTGVLALSAQFQHSTIGNNRQLQAELGVTPRWEIAWFQGLSPGEGFFASEFNLLHRGPHLLSTGVINWSTRGGGAQPVLEYGYDAGRDHVSVGALRTGDHTDLLAGYKRDLTRRFALSADFQSGAGSSTTFGFTFNLTDDLSVNPAVYYTNSHPHHFLGYVVLTWNLPVWKSSAGDK